MSDNDHEPLLLAKQKKDETETNKQTSNSSKEKKLKGNDKDAPILIAKRNKIIKIMKIKQKVNQHLITKSHKLKKEEKE